MTAEHYPVTKWGSVQSMSDAELAQRARAADEFRDALTRPRTRPPAPEPVWPDVPEVTAQTVTPEDLWPQAGRDGDLYLTCPVDRCNYEVELPNGRPIREWLALGRAHITVEHQTVAA